MSFVYLFFMEKNGKERTTTFFTLVMNFRRSSFLLLSCGHFTAAVPGLPSCTHHWLTCRAFQRTHNLAPVTSQLHPQRSRSMDGRCWGGESYVLLTPSVTSGFSLSSLTWETLRLEHGSPALWQANVTPRVRPR